MAPSELLLTPITGLPITQTITMYNCVAHSANLDYKGGAADQVYMSSVSRITPPAGGLPLRWFYWPYGSCLKGDGTAYSTGIILTVTAPKPNTWTPNATYNPSTDATAVATMTVGCYDSASASIRLIQSHGGSNNLWQIDSTGQYARIFFNMYMNAGGQTFASSSFTVNNGGNFSVIIPKFFLPTGYSVTMTDILNL